MYHLLSDWIAWSRFRD